MNPKSKAWLNTQKPEWLRSRAQKLGIDTENLTTKQELIESILSHESSEASEAATPAGSAEPDETVPEPAEANNETVGSSGQQEGTVDTGITDLSKGHTGKGANRLPAQTDRCWFRVAAGHKADEKGPVFAAINGESILVHRNTWVQMPLKYLPVFRDALTSEVVVLEGGKSVVRDVPRFNYEVRSLSEGKPKESQLPRGF